MNKDIVCHFSPIGGIDDKIAQVLNNGYTRKDIGALRGMYDTENESPLIDPLIKDKDVTGMQLLEAASKLMKYKKQQTDKHLAQMRDSQSHMAKTFNQLYHVPGWDASVRRHRINMVAIEFSNEVSRRMADAKKKGLSITREQIINGYRSNGQRMHGQLSVFESVFDKFVGRLNEARGILATMGDKTDEQLREYYIKENEKNSEEEKWSEEEINQAVQDDRADIEWANKRVAEYPKILQNWAALCTFARMSLRDTEGLKLGQTLEYAAPTTPDNFSMDSPKEDTYDLEESVREAWMNHHSETSAYSSLGAEVRRFLATITEVDENGKKVTDDLGYFVRMDPVATHRYLADILRGITSESSMVRKLKSLADTDPEVKAIFDALAKAAQVDLRKSIDDTNKPKNPAILTQFLLDMHKNMVPYTALIKKGGNVLVKLLNRQANPLHDEFVLRMQLHDVIDPAYSVYDNEGKIDWEKLAQWNIENRGYLTVPSEQQNSSIFDNQKFAGFYKVPFMERIHYMVRAARALGIPMTESTARKIYNNPVLRKDYLTALQEFRTETRNAYGGDIRKSLDVIEKYEGIRPSVNSGYTQEAREEYDNALNVLKSFNDGRSISYEEFRRKTRGKLEGKQKGFGNDRIIRMLDALAKVDNRLKIERRVSWYDRKGKANSRFSDTTPSYMGDLVDRIHEFVNEGDRDGLQYFIEDRWGHSSFFVKDINAEHGHFEFYNKWLQEMYDSIRIDNNGKVIVSPDAMAKIFEFDEFLGSDIDKQVSIFENFTEKQHAEAMIKQFLQPRSVSAKSTLAKYPCFILGDSGAQMFFTARRYSDSDILSGMRDVYRQEIERMKYVNATNDALLKDFADRNGHDFETLKSKSLSELYDMGFRPIENFSRTSDEFTMLKFLNPSFAEGKYWKVLTGEEKVPEGESLVSVASESIDTDALTEAIESYMNDSFADFMKKLSSIGVLSESKGDGGVITYSDTRGYFSHNLNRYNSLSDLLKDFFWNTKYATIQQLQLFTVDPSFYDYRYPIKDLQKRYKEIYAPGKGVSTEARDFNGELYTSRSYETAVYFDDISVSSEDINPEFFKLLKKTFGEGSHIVDAYTKNTLTDGQGYRTLESYRAVRGMAGEWTRPMEAAYRKIMAIRNNGRPLTEEDIREIAQLAVNFQPIKPYLYTLEKLKINDNDMALIPVQHKYAEIVLIPELMQEGKLKDMAVWMENNDIDLVASTKCVKVGAFGSTVLKGASTTEEVNAALDKAYVHRLPWADYRIQSGVPEHLNHAQLFGTQIRKLILAGINKKDNYNYLSNILGKSSDPLGPTVYLPGMGNVHLTGRNLISLYNCLIMANLFDSYDRLSASTDSNQALSDKMIQNIISNTNEAEDNAFGLSIIGEGDFKGEFLIPLGEPGMEHDAAALLFSLFKKNVNKQKIKGGSAVQASPFGLSGYEEVGDLFEVLSPEGDNVLYDEIEMPWNLSYTSATGNNVPLRMEDWCNTDGTLKMSDKIVYGEDALEYLSWPVSGRDRFGRAKDPSQGYYVPLIETKYKGILDIIAYRIPTERDYSMINCKIFRFSDPLAGGVLKVPSSRTTTAGFDFDIDKLYFFMREFAQTHLSDKQIEEIWSKIYGLKYDRNNKIIGGNEIYDALVKARGMDGFGKDLVSTAAEMFKDLAGIGDLNKNLEARGRLYNYWEAAGLEGTPEEAFTKYLEDHRDEYPVFDTYNPEVSPLNPVTGKNGEIITKGNSRVARNNMLIDLIRQRLMDKETLKDRYTPGGFDNNRDAALRMRVLQFADKKDITENGKIDWHKVDDYVQRIKKGEIKDPEPEYDVSDPTAILVYNQQNQIADKLIGIFANQNTNHVYASTLHELALRNPIRFGNNTVKGLFDLIHAPEGIDASTNMAEYLAASVDAVKDPVLNFLNLNLTTADAGALLARIGYTPQEIGLLFNQPIIKDVCSYIANENTTSDVAISKMLKKYGGKKATLKNFTFDASKASSDRLADNIINTRDMEDTSKMSADFKTGQLHVLWLFNELLADAEDLNSFVQCTKFTAANSIGSTWGDQLSREDRVNTFIEKYMKEYENSERDPRRLFFKLADPSEVRSNLVVSPEDANMGGTNQGILNNSEKLLDLTPNEYMAQMSRNPLAFEQCMMDLTRKATRTLFKKHFPYYTQLYTNMRDIMNRLTKYGSLDADTVNSLHREFMVYLLSRQAGSSFDGEALWEGFDGSSGLTNREFYVEVFPEVLAALKDAGVLSGYPFFEAIKITGDSENGLFNDEGKSPEDREVRNYRMTVQGMGGLQSRVSNMLTEMWAQAFESADEVEAGGLKFKVSDLAKYCYFYNFYRLGWNFHPTGFMNLAPTLLKMGLMVTTDTSERTYINFIRDVIAGDVNMDGNALTLFAQQYILNHLDNKKFVFTPKGEARSAIKAYNEEGEYWNNSFTVSLKSLDDNIKSQFLVSDDSLKEGEVAFRPVIAVERNGIINYYMADSSGVRFNVTDAANGVMTYRKVYALGSRGRQIQYFNNSAYRAFQNDAGSLKGYNADRLGTQSPAEGEGSAEEAEGGNLPSNAPVDTSNPTMFSDAEWKQIIQAFRSKYPSQGQGIHDNDIRSWLSDTTDDGARIVLRELSRQLDRGQKMQTIDDEGKPVDVC